MIDEVEEVPQEVEEQPEEVVVEEPVLVVVDELVGCLALSQLTNLSIMIFYS